MKSLSVDISLNTELFRAAMYNPTVLISVCKVLRSNCVTILVKATNCILRNIFFNALYYTCRVLNLILTFAFTCMDEILNQMKATNQQFAVMQFIR